MVQFDVLSTSGGIRCTLYTHTCIRQVNSTTFTRIKQHQPTAYTPPLCGVAALMEHSNFIPGSCPSRPAQLNACKALAHFTEPGAEGGFLFAKHGSSGRVVRLLLPHHKCVLMIDQKFHIISANKHDGGTPSLRQESH